MEIANNNFVGTSNEAIISVGNFDGVHLAHKEIIFFLNKYKLTHELISCIFTFENHPSTVFSDNPVKLLTTNTEKAYLLNSLGVDVLFFQKFDKEFAALSPEDFIVENLINKLKLNTLVIGDDHKIGKSRQGDYEHLKKIAQKYNFNLHQIDSVFVKGKRVSSTNIRDAIINDNLDEANLMLGYNYFMISKVISGNKIGRKIGFPTANIYVEQNKLLPKIGVYAVEIVVDGEEFKGMCNVGYRPTFNESKNITVEVNIFDFDGDIYNKDVKLSFIKKIRNELVFRNKEHLISQLYKDKQEIVSFFERDVKMKNVLIV